MTSKSELKRMCHLDPHDMAERLYNLEAQRDALVVVLEAAERSVCDRDPVLIAAIADARHLVPKEPK